VRAQLPPDLFARLSKEVESHQSPTSPIDNPQSWQFWQFWQLLDPYADPMANRCFWPRM
jgi:hypothetical protein